MTDDSLRRLSPRFEAIYATTGRPSIPPEHLLRALLLQMLYSVRSELIAATRSARWRENASKKSSAG